MTIITPEQLLQDIQRQKQETTALRELWQSLFDSCPNESQFTRWLSAHPFARMVYAIRRTGAKYARRGRQMSPEHTVKLASLIANDERRFEKFVAKTAA